MGGTPTPGGRGPTRSSTFAPLYYSSQSNYAPPRAGSSVLPPLFPVIPFQSEAPGRAPAIPLNVLQVIRDWQAQRTGAPRPSPTSMGPTQSQGPAIPSPVPGQSVPSPAPAPKPVPQGVAVPQQAGALDIGQAVTQTATQQSLAASPTIPPPAPKATTSSPALAPDPWAQLAWYLANFGDFGWGGGDGGGPPGGGDAGGGDGGGPGGAPGSIWILKAATRALGIPQAILRPIQEMSAALGARAKDVVPNYRRRAAALIDSIGRRPDWPEVYLQVFLRVGLPAILLQQQGQSVASALAFRHGFEWCEEAYGDGGALTGSPQPGAPTAEEVGARAPENVALAGVSEGG